jgi:hypothetical protein
VEESIERGQQVFSDPNLSDSNLPPEAALIFMPAKPEFPVLLDKDGEPVHSTKYPDYELHDIPFLPRVWDLDTPGWKVNLYNVMGATVDDMANRVPVDVEPGITHQKLRNRILKRTLDYRKWHGGFGQDPRPLKGTLVTHSAQNLVHGVRGKTQTRKALTPEQALFGVTWDVNLETMTMRQPGGERSYPLPFPRDVDTSLAEVMRKEKIPIPTLQAYIGAVQNIERSAPFGMAANLWKCQ